MLEEGKMKRGKMLLGGCVAVVAAVGLYCGYGAYGRARAYNVQSCMGAVMHLDRANVDACVEPAISQVYLTFSRPTRLDAFRRVVAEVQGVDMHNSRTDDSGRIFALVFYMSRTSDVIFISDVATAIDNPALYQND